jgi:hypothetical protein
MAAGTLPDCSKSSFLDKKPNTQLVVPNTLTDFQALLDNQYVMQETPELGEISADNYYMTYTVWRGLVVKEQNAYVWAKDIYNGQGLVEDWDIPYQQVFYANVVLDGLKKIKPDATNQLQYNTIKGTAFFLRAYAFYNVAQLFAPLYDSSTASKDMGIPLRLNSDVNTKSIRASVQDTYTQILTDLRQADSLLPAVVPANHLNRPSQPAALALLARVCLSIRAYDQAGAFANSCLQLYSSLMDYDSLAYTTSIPVATSNAETLYQSVMLRSSGLLLGIFSAKIIIDSTLYASYAPGDLRKEVFYQMSNGLPYLKGSYNGSGFCFSGLATDEVYLIRAECAARDGNKDAALADLNTLLQHRWVDTVVFTPITAATAAAARDSVLVERRKELAFRGLRWSDLRRLNKEGANDTLYHGLNGQGVYRLVPGSLNYVLPIPPDVISATVPDNPRVVPN